MSTQVDNHRAWEEFSKGIWKENPVFIAVLGLCPAMAVTNSLMNALVMGFATTFVLVGSSTLISLLRKVIPKPVRISIYIIVIATFVTTIDFLLAAYLPDQHAELGAFLSLIVVNCLILGRQDAFAAKNPVWLSVLDALGMSIGFTIALCMLGGIREVLGSGSLLGLSLFGPNFEPWVIMVLPPGGFFSLGALLMGFAWLSERRARKQAAGGTDAPERRTA